MKSFEEVWRKYKEKTLISSYFRHISSSFPHISSELPHISSYFPHLSSYFPHISSYFRTYIKFFPSPVDKRGEGEGGNPKLPDVLSGNNFRGEASVNIWNMSTFRIAWILQVSSHFSSGKLISFQEEKGEIEIETNNERRDKFLLFWVPCLQQEGVENSDFGQRVSGSIIFQVQRTFFRM